LIKQLVSDCSAGADPTLGFSVEHIESNVSANTNKPIAKSASLRLFQPFLNGLKDRDKDLLHNVFSISPLQTLAQRHSKNQWTVDCHHLIPCVPVLLVA
jgi:hypothetical protein